MMNGPNSTCRRCATPFEAGDIRCAVCGLMIPSGAITQPQTGLQILRCTECGAAVQYVAEAKAPQCAFCRAVMRVEQPQDPIDQVEYFVPFSFRPEQAALCFQVWLQSLGFFRPSDLKTAAQLTELRPIAWPAWVVNARALASWTADSNAGSHRSDWAPHSGQVSLEFNQLLVSASRGLSLEEANTIARGYSPPFTQRTLLGPPNTLIEQFQAQRSAARREITGNIERAAQSKLKSGHIPGTRHRNLHCSILLEGLRTSRVCFPAYVMAYRYRNRLYRTVLNGQNSETIVGTAPYSWVRIALVCILGAAVLAVIIAVVMMLVEGR